MTTTRSQTTPLQLPSVVQITRDISPVQSEPLRSPNCEGPLITAVAGAAAAGWLLMNPYWQTFSSPKNTVMSSHSAVWSQLRLPCACFLSLHKRYKGWCLTWGCQGHASMAASHACVHSHVGNTTNHVRRNKHYGLNAMQTHKHAHIQSVASNYLNP